MSLSVLPSSRGTLLCLWAPVLRVHVPVLYHCAVPSVRVRPCHRQVNLCPSVCTTPSVGRGRRSPARQGMWVTKPTRARRAGGLHEGLGHAVPCPPSVSTAGRCHSRLLVTLEKRTDLGRSSTVPRRFQASPNLQIHKHACHPISPRIYSSWQYEQKKDCS